MKSLKQSRRTEFRKTLFAGAAAAFCLVPAASSALTPVGGE